MAAHVLPLGLVGGCTLAATTSLRTPAAACVGADIRQRLVLAGGAAVRNNAGRSMRGMSCVLIGGLLSPRRSRPPHRKALSATALNQDAARLWSRPLRGYHCRPSRRHCVIRRVD